MDSKGAPCVKQQDKPNLSSVVFFHDTADRGNFLYFPGLIRETCVPKLVHPVVVIVIIVCFNLRHLIANPARIDIDGWVRQNRT